MGSENKVSTGMAYVVACFVTTVCFVTTNMTKQVKFDALPARFVTLRYTHTHTRTRTHTRYTLLVTKYVAADFHFSLEGSSSLMHGSGEMLNKSEA